ncbi:hypothetical protein Ddye_022835, partial [Dipteronia dyeriana]
VQKNKGKKTRLGEFDTGEKELKDRVCNSLTRWMYDVRILFNVVNCDSFKVFCEALGHYGLGIKPPSFYEVKVPLFEKEVENTSSAIKDHMETWVTHGCSIL